jgi:hypothetical protein
MGYFLIGEFKEGFDMKLKKTVTYKKKYQYKKIN